MDVVNILKVAPSLVFEMYRESKLAYLNMLPYLDTTSIEEQ